MKEYKKISPDVDIKVRQNAFVLLVGMFQNSCIWILMMQVLCMFSLDTLVKYYYNDNKPVLQQPITGPGPPHCEVSGSCRRTPWASDQLAARWPDHYPPQIYNHSRSAHQNPLAVRPAETPSSEAGDWARNIATQFCLQSVSTLVGFFYMP
jgi:hypothetical protein